MAIDTSGQWWRGKTFSDLAEYIRTLTSEGYPATSVRQSICRCGSTTFRLLFDADEGCARRQCTRCSELAFIGDSAELWDSASPTAATCPCGSTDLELGIGFSERPDGEIRWITVGQRCTRCGVLAAFVDWGVDYAPTSHLRALV